MLLPVSGDAIIVLVGLGVYLATCLVTRHALTWAWALLPGLVFAVALEAWEIWDHYRLAGLAKHGTSSLLAVSLRHAKDVLLFNLGPVAVFLSAHLLERLTRS